jgi:hypothetical protein
MQIEPNQLSHTEGLLELLLLLHQRLAQELGVGGERGLQGSEGALRLLCVGLGLAPGALQLVPHPDQGLCLGLQGLASLLRLLTG